MRLPKVTFGVIVLNGEPFVRHNLRSLYPFAHEIIVVEGAAPGATAVAAPNGHSSDGTLEILRQFKAHEDPQDKLRIVTAEDEGYANGFWPGEKDEQSKAYAKRATGEYLWQVDIDEFYQPRDMLWILELLRNDPQVTAVSFRQITFWGGFDYVADGWYLRAGAQHYHRLFRWQPGYRYITHRPPTVVDELGRDVRKVKWVRGEWLAKRGVLLYHYSLVFPKQVREKCDYYAKAQWAKRVRAVAWAEDCFTALKNPFSVHNVYTHPSWLDRFHGQHPPQIDAMRQAIRNGLKCVEQRSTEDVERLLNDKAYLAKRFVLRSITPLYTYWLRARRAVVRGVRGIGGALRKSVDLAMKGI